MRLFCSFFYITFFLITVSACSKTDETIPMLSSDEYNTQYKIECSYSKYMELQPEGGNEAQGAACYGDYLVQGYNYNGCITIYNLKEKTRLGTIAIPEPEPNSNIHANTLNFSSQRYQADDYFPLLYISSGYTSDLSYIYVYRLKKEIDGNGNDVFSISLVQTISLYNFGSWTEGIIDSENNCLWIKYSRDSNLGYAQYMMPRIDESIVYLFYDDYIRDFKLNKEPLHGSNQGHLFVNNHIVLVSGIPSRHEDIVFISINTLTEKRDYIIDLFDIGLVNPENLLDNTYEPESVIIYDGQLFICYRNALYLFDVSIENIGSTTIKNTSNVIKNSKVIYNVKGVLQNGVGDGLAIVRQSDGTFYKALHNSLKL